MRPLLLSQTEMQLRHHDPPEQSSKFIDNQGGIRSAILRSCMFQMSAENFHCWCR